MKKQTSLTVLLFCASAAYAQSNLDQALVDAYQKEAGDHAELFYAPLETPFNVTRWHNDPFWDGTEGQVGTVLYNGVLYKDVLMRFNVAEQQLCVAAPQSKMLVVPDMSKVEGFTIDGQPFEKINGVYARLEISDGKELEFWNAKTKAKGKDVLINNRSYYSYEETNYYYVKINGELHQVKKAKDVAKLFLNNKELMRQLRETDFSVQGERAQAMKYVFRQAIATGGHVAQHYNR